MAVKDLIFRILGEDTVSPVFKEISVQAEASAAKVSEAYKAAGVSMETSMTKGSAAASESGFARMGKSAMMGAGVVVLAAGVVAAKTVGMAADFQTSITRLQTSAGESKANLDLVAQGILNMAGETSTSAQDLAKGMYTVESAGYHGAAALQVLKASAQGAAVEGANLTDVTNAVTTAMNDYGLKGAKGAAVATNTLLAAVSRGKTTFEDLASAMPTILPTSSALGLSFQETAGAMATMTGEGVSASKAATYLKQTLGNLASGGSAIAQKTMQQLGLSATKVSQELGNRGLAATVGTISSALKDHLTPAGLEAMTAFEKGKGSAASYKTLMGSMSPPMQTTFGMLAKMTGGVRGLSGFLALSGSHLKTFKDNTDAISKSVQDSGKHIDGYSQYQKTMNAKVEEAKASIEALGIGIGTDLLPYVSKAAGYVAEFTAYLAKHKAEVEIVLVAVAGLAAGFLIVAGVATLLASTTFLVVAGIVAVAAAFAIAYRDSTTFRNGVNTAMTDIRAAISATVHEAIALWHEFGSTILSIARTYLSGVVDFFKGEFNFIVGIVKLFKDILTGNWRGLWGDVKQIASGALQALWGLFKMGFATLTAIPRLAWTAIRGDVSSAWHSISSAVSSGVSSVIGFVASLPGRASSALGSLGGELVSKGNDLISGFRNGVTSAWNTVTSFLGGIPGKAASAVGSLGGILLGAGASLIQGLIDGITSKISSVQSTLSGLTSKLTSWKGPPSKDAMLLYHNGQLLIQGFVKGLVSQYSNVRSTLTTLTSEIQSLNDSAIKSQMLAQDHLLTAATGRWNQLNTLLDNAKQKLQALQQQSQQYAQQIASSIIGSGNVTGQTNAAGTTQTTLSGIIGGLTQARHQAQQFSSVFRKLKAEGLNKTALDQLAQSGPAGLAQAQAILGGGAHGIHQINALQAQLAHAAETIGHSAAGSMYGAGESAAEGLIKGLQSRENQLDAEMRRMAGTLVGAIKRLLGIHSPSTVFAEIGDNIVIGLAGGVNRSAHRAHSAIEGLVPVMPGANAAGSAGGRTGAAAGHSAATAHNGRQRPTVNIEHYHEAGLTPAQVAADLIFAAA